MSSLNRDILNPICEKLIFDGNQNAIFNFAFSGKKSLEALKWKFSTITHLELYNDCYKIGWGKPSTTFFLNGPKIHSEKLTKFIGGKVQSLHFDTCNPIYYSIIDNIIKNNEVDTLSIGKNCHLDDVVELISVFSESIKHLKISSFYMVKKFKKHLNLDSLILTDIACPNFVFFPVTTPSLIVQSTPLGNKTSWQKFYEMIGFSNIASSFISSVENLTFDDRTMKKSVTDDSLMEIQMGQIFNALSSLKILNFEVNFSFASLSISEFFDRNIIQEHFGIFDNLAKSTDLQNFPKKIIYFVYNWVEADIDKFKIIFHYFQFDDTKKEYLCLGRKIKSWMPEDTVFEIRFVH